MAKFFVGLLILALCCGHLNAQMFTPSASQLPNGDLNQPYVGQTIDFTVSNNATISGELVVQALSIVYPQTQPVLGFLNIDNQEFPIVVERTTLIPQGLPSGMSANCDATPCTYMAGASGYITLAGTPTETGQFGFDITTLSEGAVDISSITGGVLSSFGLPTSLGLPVPVPSSLDEEGYALLVQNTSRITERNEVLSISLSPNPVNQTSQLLIDTKEAGQVFIEIFSSTGSLIANQANVIRLGSNIVKFETANLESGIYLVKVSLKEYPALLRMIKQ